MFGIEFEWMNVMDGLEWNEIGCVCVCMLASLLIIVISFASKRMSE